MHTSQYGQEQVKACRTYSVERYPECVQWKVFLNGYTIALQGDMVQQGDKNVTKLSCILLSRHIL